MHSGLLGSLAWAEFPLAAGAPNAQGCQFQLSQGTVCSRPKQAEDLLYIKNVTIVLTMAKCYRLYCEGLELFTMNPL